MEPCPSFCVPHAGPTETFHTPWLHGSAVPAYPWAKANISYLLTSSLPMTHSPWSTAHTNTRSKASRELPRASSPGSWQQGALLSAHLPQKHTFISSRPCWNSKSMFAGKDLHLGAEEMGREAGWTWRDCTALHQERDRHWKKRISPRGNQAQAKEVGMQKI